MWLVKIAVTTHLKSERLLRFGFALQYQSNDNGSISWLLPIFKYCFNLFKTLKVYFTRCSFMFVAIWPLNSAPLKLRVFIRVIQKIMPFILEAENDTTGIQQMIPVQVLNLRGWTHSRRGPKGLKVVFEFESENQRVTEWEVFKLVKLPIKVEYIIIQPVCLFSSLPTASEFLSHLSLILTDGTKDPRAGFQGQGPPARCWTSRERRRNV